MNDRPYQRAADYSHSLIEASLDPLVTIGPDGKITDVNSATEKVTGRTRVELIGSYFSNYFSEPEKAKKGYKLAFDTGSVIDYPLEIRDKNGKITPVLYNASVYKDRSGSVIGVFAAARDITEIKRAEEELKKTNELLESIMNSSTAEIILATDSTGTILTWNEGAGRLLGYEPEEVVGKENIRILYTKEYLKSAMESNRYRMIATKKPLMNETTFVAKGGRTFPVRQIVTPRFSEAGEFIGMLRLVRDITERKQVEAELKQAKEMAEAANRAKSEFLANMSHEIRTPMNAILGFSDLLLEGELRAEHREAIQTINKSGESLLNLINDILDLSKVESSKIELETIPFNVENLVLDIGETLMGNLGEKPIEIICNIGDIHTNLMGDPTRLRQVVTNLVGNAIKFTEEGEIAIEVRNAKSKVQNEEDGENDKVELLFSVRDTGIGIPKDKLEDIFEAFRQVDGSTTRKYGGTGLGLTISKKLAQVMGGDMWVESPAGGRGSTFYFTAQFKKNLESSEAVYPVHVSRLEGKQILIVDDNETALKIVADIVKRVGMVPITAKSGEEALRHFRSSIMDIAIIDIIMPEMSGHELARKIFDLTRGKTKMIALSCNVVLGSGAETKESGFVGFVSKPVRRQVLLDMIRTVLGIGEKQPKCVVTQHKVREIIAHDVRILYAEDNLVNQKLGQKIFERMGYNRVEIVPDGLEAVKMVKENGPFDIIFMDIQMPHMSGIEATKEIRKWEEKLKAQGSKLKGESDGDLSAIPEHIPIVALTANAMKGDREKYLEAGMDEYLSKPFKRDEIQGMIRDWVTKVEVPAELSDEMRILLVEDEENMRKSIIRLLKKEMPAAKVMCAEDGIDASAKLGSFVPDIILTDIRMPRMDGAEFIRYIRNTERYAQAKIIVITGLHEDDPRVAAVKEAGVENIFFKPCEYKDLILAISGCSF